MKLFLFLLPGILLIACQSQQGTPADNAQPVATANAIPGYLDTLQDQWICEDQTLSASAFSDKSAEFASITKLDSTGEIIGMGLIDRQGVIRVPVVYDGITVGFTDSVCQVQRKNLIGLVNWEGKEIVAPQYDMLADHATFGLLRAVKNDSVGMINLKGEVVIPIQYAQADAVGEGLIAFMHKPQQWGFINLKNEVVIPPQFTFVAPFENGKVVLQKADGENYIVYPDGKIVKQ